MTSANTSSKIHRRTVREWLEFPYEWRIPVYQRHYAWDAEEEFGPTEQFWKLVAEYAEKRLDDRPVFPNYFGAILVENRSEDLDQQRYDVVDGQQRLTTITVALFSLLGLAAQQGHKPKFAKEFARYIFCDHAANPPQQPKLVPTNFDQVQYQNLLYHAYPESEPAERRKRVANDDKSMVIRACHFFNQRFGEFFDRHTKGDAEMVIDALCDALLDGFSLVAIPLEKNDEAQKIFEALNNTARPLTTFDLIRNNIFYRADKEEKGLDEKLFHGDMWQQFETNFWEQPFNKKGGDNHVETYVARMLVAKQKKLLLLKRNSIYLEYKKFATDNHDFYGVKKEIEAISEYVDVYKHLVGENNNNPVSDEFDFGYFKSNYKDVVVFLPVIFTIATLDASAEDKQKMINLLESWFIRRNICKLAGDYNKQVPQMCEKLTSRNALSAFADMLHESQDDTRAFPSRARLEATLQTVDFYSQKLAWYVFDRMVWDATSHTRNARRHIDKRTMTIDHLIPQGWDENEEWRKTLIGHGDDIVAIKIHTIGNLTPVEKGINSGKSNLPWTIKDGKGARDWLRESDLKITRDLAESNESWAIEQVDERTKALASTICEIWPDDTA